MPSSLEGVCGFPGLRQNCPVSTPDLLSPRLLQGVEFFDEKLNSLCMAWLVDHGEHLPRTSVQRLGLQKGAGRVDWGRCGEWVSPDCCQVHGAAPLLSGFPPEGRVGGGCIRLPVAARSSGDSEGHPAESLSLNPTSWLSKLKHVTCHL